MKVKIKRVPVRRKPNYQTARRYQMGGMMAEPQEVQIEKGEELIFDNNMIVKPKAKKRHSRMSDYEVTDILPVGTYVASRDPSQKIDKRFADNYVVQMPGPIIYDEKNVGKKLKEKTLGDLFSKKYHTPADIARKIRNKFPTTKADDIFAQNAVEQNLVSRTPYIEALKTIAESKRQSNSEDMDQTFMMQRGGNVRKRRRQERRRSRREEKELERMIKEGLVPDRPPTIYEYLKNTGKRSDDDDAVWAYTRDNWIGEPEWKKRLYYHYHTARGAKGRKYRRWHKRAKERAEKRGQQQDLPDAINRPTWQNSQRKRSRKKGTKKQQQDLPDAINRPTPYGQSMSMIPDSDIMIAQSFDILPEYDDMLPEYDDMMPVYNDILPGYTGIIPTYRRGGTVRYKGYGRVPMHQDGWEVAGKEAGNILSGLGQLISGFQVNAARKRAEKRLLANQGLTLADIDRFEQDAMNRSGIGLGIGTGSVLGQFASQDPSYSYIDLQPVRTRTQNYYNRALQDLDLQDRMLGMETRAPLYTMSRSASYMDPRYGQQVYDQGYSNYLKSRNQSGLQNIDRRLQLAGQGANQLSAIDMQEIADRQKGDMYTRSAQNLLNQGLFSGLGTQGQQYLSNLDRIQAASLSSRMGARGQTTSAMNNLLALYGESLDRAFSGAADMFKSGYNIYDGSRSEVDPYSYEDDPLLKQILKNQQKQYPLPDDILQRGGFVRFFPKYG